MSDGKPRLPGDLPQRDREDRKLRAEHAGEYAVSGVYAGQRLTRDEGALRCLAHEIGQRRVRPSALLPLWRAAGFAVGAVTAAMGPKTAASCRSALDDALSGSSEPTNHRLLTSLLRQALKVSERV